MREGSDMRKPKGTVVRGVHYLIHIPAILTVILLISGSSFAQDEEKPIIFSRRMEISVTNPGDIVRINEPVVIPVEELKRTSPDFNAAFFRVKHPSDGFEPLDIPSQILKIEGALYTAENLAFVLDLAPSESKTVELWYNPKGEDPTPYPPATQSFEKWYRLGGNIAWENELVAYRSYTGLVDYFAKSFPHLRLHDLPPDSYHHERFWGLDPYMIGTKPGLCGVVIASGAEIIKCYTVPDDTGMTFNHKAIDGGPVVSGAIVQVIKDGKLIVEEIYMLFAGRRENRVITVVPSDKRDAGTRVRVGMQSFENIPTVKGDGYFAFQGTPIKEYGVISTGLVWKTADSDGIHAAQDGDFVSLKPDSEGRVYYSSVALWNRASADPPASNSAFTTYINDLKKTLENPVTVTVKNVK